MGRAQYIQLPDKDRKQIMILEHALLQVKPGLEADFEKAMREALPPICRR